MNLGLRNAFVQRVRSISWLVIGQQQQQLNSQEKPGHATPVLGVIELDLHTGRATGRRLLQVISNRKKSTLKRLLTQHIVPGL